jgi:site-specific DNA-methyltransferase (adenine-specific)
MKNIPDGSVDLVLTDPPYGTMKGAALDGWKNQTTEWDTAIDPVKIFEQISRVLRQNGKVVLFSQEPYTSRLITSAIPSLPFAYRAMWYKNVHANALLAKSAMVSRYEDICIFTKPHDAECTNELRDYFKKVLEFIGVKSCKEINARLGHRKAEHCFYVTKGKRAVKDAMGGKADHTTRIGSSQFALCTEQTYNEIVSVFGIDKMDGFLPYVELARLNEKYTATFNLWQGGKSKSNVLEYKKDNDGYHPTQKPVALLEDLIQTYSNEGNTVLDFTAGSMSTVVACINTKRNCIAIEKDEHYFNVGCERVHNHILGNNIDLCYNQVCGGVVLWQNSKTEQAKDMDGF